MKLISRTSVNNIKEFWKNQTRNYKLFMTRDLLQTLFGNMANQYGTIYMRTLGASVGDIGFLTSAQSLVRVLLSLPGGILTDRVKRVKRLYLGSRFLSLPVNLMKAFATSWPVYFWTRIWEVMTWRILMPTGRIISIAAITNRDRVKALALNRTVFSAVGLIAPIIAAYAVTYFGGLDRVESFRPLFLIQFVVSVVIFLIFATQLVEPEFQKSSPRKVGVLQSTLEIFTQVPGLKMILLLNLVRNFLMQIRMPLIQVYFYEVKNADAFVIAYQSTISTAVALLFSVPLSNLAERVGRRKMGYLSQIVYVLCILAAIFTPATHPNWLLLYSFFQSLGSAMDVAWNAFIQEYIPLDVRGRWMGVNTTLTSLVSIPGPIIGSIIWNINPDYLWWISLIFYLFLAIPLRMRIPEKKSS
jgi:MFS family permease